MLDHTPSLASRETASPSFLQLSLCQPAVALVRAGAPGVYAWGGPEPRHEGDTRRGAERPQEPARERSPPIPPSKENNIYNFSSLREGLSGVNARDPLGEEGSGKIPRAPACAVPARHDARVSRTRVT